jgi:two-component system cell cycle sensor histidine kinase/response regulator CckA
MTAFADIPDGAAAQQERRYRALVEHSTDLVALVGADRCIIYVSPSFESTLGHSCGAWHGRDALDFIWPDDRVRAVALFARAAAAPGEVIPWQLRARHLDGTFRCLEGTGANYAADPAIGGMVINCRDVTERMRAQQALVENEQLLRQAVRVSDIGIFVHDQVADSIYWSPRQREIHGWGPDEPVTLDSFLSLVHPDDAGAIMASVQRAHNPAGSGSWEVEYRIVRRDGATRWLIARSQTSFEAQGPARRPVRTVGATIDITERKRDEEALRRSEAMLRLFYDLPFIGMAVSSPETKRWVQVNQTLCDMFGYCREELLQTTWTDITHPEDIAADLADLERVKRGEADSYKLDKRFIRRDGGVVYASIDVKAVRAADGCVELLVMMIADISAAKLLQAQFLQAQKMESVGRLAGGVAHDFNNLLTVIKGYLELALEGLPPADPLRAHLAEVNKAADSAASLTQRLLAFSRKQMISPKVLDLDVVIGNVRRMLQRLIGEDIHLEAVAGPDLWPVRFDPGQGEQILVNLAVNARDAMPDGGTLRLETANVRLEDDQTRRHPGVPPGEYVRLSVSDTGSGMSADVQAHLFEPFFTTKGPGRGTGLGLAMVYGAVSQNLGHIEVTSESGRGTTFGIYLPRAVDDGAPPETELDGAMPRGTETVVLVEDDEAVRTLALLLLTRLGYSVRAFASGPEALAAVAGQTAPIDLLITDVIMPDMNGRILAERLIALRPGTRVLFASGYTSDAIVHHGVLDADVAFLAKPYSVDALARRVREVLDAAST